MSDLAEIAELNIEAPHSKALGWPSLALGRPSGETVIELTSATSWFASATATVCGIELDNGAWHWTTVTAVASPNITIGTAIPVGRTVAVGADVIYNSWRPLANVA